MRFKGLFIIALLALVSIVPFSCRHSFSENRKSSELLQVDGDRMHVRCDVTAGLNFYKYTENVPDLGLDKTQKIGVLVAGTDVELIKRHPNPPTLCFDKSGDVVIVKALGELGAACLNYLDAGPAQACSLTAPPVVVGGEASIATSHNGIKGYHFLQGSAEDLFKAPHATELGSSGGWGLVDNYENANVDKIDFLAKKGYKVVARLDYKSHQSVPLASDANQMQAYINMATAAKNSGAQHIVLGNELNLDGLYDGNPYSECSHTRWPGTSTSIKEDEPKKLERLDFHLSTNSACSPKNYALVYQRIAQMFPNIVFYVAGVSPSQQETDFNDKSKIVKTDFEVRWAQGDYWLYQTIVEIKAIMGVCPSGVALHAYGDISESGEGTLVNDIKSQIRALTMSGCTQGSDHS
jgi:hypothetical protein